MEANRDCSWCPKLGLHIWVECGVIDFQLYSQWRLIISWTNADADFFSLFLFQLEAEFINIAADLINS